MASWFSFSDRASRSIGSYLMVVVVVVVIILEDSSLLRCWFCNFRFRIAKEAALNIVACNSYPTNRKILFQTAGFSLSSLPYSTLTNLNLNPAPFCPFHNAIHHPNAAEPLSTHKIHKQCPNTCQKSTSVLKVKNSDKRCRVEAKTITTTSITLVSAMRSHMSSILD